MNPIDSVWSRVFAKSDIISKNCIVPLTLECFEKIWQFLKILPSPPAPISQELFENSVLLHSRIYKENCHPGELFENFTPLPLPMGIFKKFCPLTRECFGNFTPVPVSWICFEKLGTTAPWIV